MLRKKFKAEEIVLILGDIEQTKSSIFEYIEVFYNRKGLHTKLECLSSVAMHD